MTDQALSRRRVEVAQDHVSSLVGSAPTKGLVELVWNAFDAGGQLVDIALRENELGVVHSIEIADEGPGISPEEVEAAFGSIGNSSKVKRQANPDGRLYHGREGKGRFRALSICASAEWRTTYKDSDGIWTHSIFVRRTAPDFYETTELTPANTSRTGTRVVLDGIDAGSRIFGSSSFVETLAEAFAGYLTSYPGVRLVWAGHQLRIESLIDRQKEITFLPTRDGEEPATLRIIEWRFKPDGKRLHICDEEGFSYFHLASEIRSPGIEFTAYVDTPMARRWADANAYALGGLDPDIDALVKAARGELRSYFRTRLAEQAQGVVEEWKAQHIYPFADIEGLEPIALAQQEVFDIVAAQVNEQHATFSRSDLENKRLTLALIRQALEANPADLTKILGEVTALSEDDRSAFAELLDRTPLSNIVRAGKIVTDRLDTIQAFEHMLFDKDWRKRLLERTQLHRLLVNELWLLGEEYALGADDDSLKALLREHIRILGRGDLATEPDAPIDDVKSIPDLMLYRRRKVDRDHFEHLVVELKRPSVVLGQDETAQVRKYAFAVAQDERFDTRRCTWEFVLLGNSFDRFVELETSADNLPEGCIYARGGVRIWARTWADVLNHAKARYEFFRERLNLEASQEHGMNRLRDRYSHILSGRGVSKRKEKQIMGAPF